MLLWKHHTNHYHYLYIILFPNNGMSIRSVSMLVLSPRLPPQSLLSSYNNNNYVYYIILYTYYLLYFNSHKPFIEELELDVLMPAAIASVDLLAFLYISLSIRPSINFCNI